MLNNNNYLFDISSLIPYYFFMSKFYLKVTGSACYDTKGITFPKDFSNQVNLRELLENHGAKEIEFSNQFGWSNQPKVYCFEIDASGKAVSNYMALRKSISRLNLPLVVARKWWRK